MSRMPLAAAMALALSAPAQADYQYPAQPDSPTWKDCTTLAQEYHAILGDLYAQQNACMRQEPQFGHGTRCDGSWGAVPWAQCQEIVLQTCKVRKDADSAIETCRFRAAVNVEGGSSDILGSMDAFDRFHRVIDTGNQIHGAWSDATRLLNDPGAFLRNALQSRLTSELQNRFAPQGDLSRDGEELYRHLFRAARSGTRQTSSNPVVGAIQGESLSYLEARFADLLYQLDEVSAAAARFSAER